MHLFLLFLLLLSLTANSSAFLGNIFGKLLPKNRCPIKLYNPEDSSFTGVKLYTNAETFHPLLETLSDYAKRCHVKINVKQAFIQENSAVHKIITSDRIASAFQLGEAIEVELVDQHKNVICNRFCMEKNFSHMKRSSNAKCFLKKISRNHDLQQDFNKPTILMKRTKPNESLVTIHDQRKDLQNKCKKLKMD
jgi:hypothetical protein